MYKNVVCGQLASKKNSLMDPVIIIIIIICIIIIIIIIIKSITLISVYIVIRIYH